MVSGVVVKQSDGSPVAGMKVIMFGYGRREAMTDAQGRFTIKKVSNDNYPQKIFAYGGTLIARPTPVKKLSTSKAGAIYEPVRLTMVEGKQVKIVLTAKDTGKPLAGVRIRFDYPDSRKVLSDKNGAAMLTGLQPESYTLHLFADGYCRKSLDFDLSVSTRLQEYKVEMELGGIVRGVVIDETGKPVAGAFVGYHTESSPNDWWNGDANQTDKNGKFQDRFAPLNTAIVVGA